MHYLVRTVVPCRTFSSRSDGESNFYTLVLDILVMDSNLFFVVSKMWTLASVCSFRHRLRWGDDS